MTVDREQIRRDAELIDPNDHVLDTGLIDLAGHCLALLAELEQAEARLAKVPALVEALMEACDWLDADLAHAPDTITSMADRDLISRWRSALAAWEAE